MSKLAQKPSEVFLKPFSDELSDKSLKPENDLDGVCLEFEQCSECVKMDGCDLDADFMPKMNGTQFECDHLISSPCQEMFQ